MTNFIWPSDQDRAENDELNRVCEYLEEVLAEREALAAKLARYSMCAGRAEQRQSESRAVRKALGFNPDADDVSPRDLLDALARLKAQWQADGAESFKAELLKSTKTFIHPHIEGVHAVWLRRQAEETAVCPGPDKCDDQFAPDPSSREAAIEAMVMEVQPHEWRQGGAMRYQGHLITWGEYVQAAEKKGRKFDRLKAEWQAETNWINAADELPECDEDDEKCVLCSDGHRVFEEFAHLVLWGLSTGEITHWAPLPAPPGRQAEETSHGR